MYLEQLSPVRIEQLSPVPYLFTFDCERNMTIKEKQVSCRSPGYAPVPPSYSQVASSANVLSNGERALNK